MLEKVRLRETMKARRAALSPDARDEAAAAVAARVCRLAALHQGGTVSGFLSIGEEMDTGPLLAALHAAGHSICLPVMQGKGRPLIFRAYIPGEALATVVWGIREPTPEKTQLIPRVLIVPLLAFDRQGWRLGYGGGFYDRTLRELRATGPVSTVGIGFDQQEVDAVPHLDYDEPLDWVLTPSETIACRR